MREPYVAVTLQSALLSVFCSLRKNSGVEHLLEPNAEGTQWN